MWSCLIVCSPALVAPPNRCSHTPSPCGGPLSASKSYDLRYSEFEVHFPLWPHSVIVSFAPWRELSVSLNALRPRGNAFDPLAPTQAGRSSHRLAPPYTFSPYHQESNKIDRYGICCAINAASTARRVSSYVWHTPGVAARVRNSGDCELIGEPVVEHDLHALFPAHVMSVQSQML